MWRYQRDRVGLRVKTHAGRVGLSLRTNGTCVGVESCLADGREFGEERSWMECVKSCSLWTTLHLVDTICSI